MAEALEGMGGVPVAVLIDADNVAADYLEAVLQEAARFGRPTIRRVYGNWTGTELQGWKKLLHEHALQPVQQFAYVPGKNATDTALIIDAMDILHGGQAQVFCLVSSDSDYTRLAMRLREAGKTATDTALIIDAMDILHGGQAQVFCLVSSDSDYTRLAMRLREAGKTVV